MLVLVLNCGSSSVKFQLIQTSPEDIEAGTEKKLARGNIEKIGMTTAIVSFQAEGKPAVKETPVILEHRVAIERVLTLLTDPQVGILKSRSEIGAVGHRVVHGGEKFSKSQVITGEVYRQIVECCELAPLHNPHNVRGYEIAHELLPDVPHVAVFDTAFHQTMPEYAYIYGLPMVVYRRHGIRRYGFHGTSHRYLTWRMQKLLNKPASEFNLITCHLGNGCSITAVERGKSVDTSMGFTPLEGLIMGTRSGDLDPAVVLHIMAKEELTLHEANTMLNKHSGLIGVSGISNDMRELVKEYEKGNKAARLAIDLFCYRLKKYIAAYFGVLNGADALAFTGGIGENSPLIRTLSCAGLECLGIKIDPERNEELNRREGCISSDDAKVGVYIVPTDEEMMIARDTVHAVAGKL
ncbi:MAG: acetate kinase [Candidatus Sumerlaeia bacterium]|nr:acetate kinase [Candidatus Sumerlaeia bacterium]